MGNSLVYIDPDGELFWLIPVAIGAAMGGWTGYQIGKAHGATGWNMVGYIAGGAIIGGVSGYAGATIYQSGLKAAIAAGSSGISASASAGMLSGMASGAISNGGFTALAGGNLNDVMGSMIQGTVVGGFSGAAGGATFKWANNQFDKMGILKNFMFQNTFSYMLSSTASEMIANIVQGRSPFEDVDYGMNLGIVVPMFADISLFNKSLKLYLAKKNNTENLNFKIKSTWGTMTELQENGDLNMDSGVYGEKEVHTFTRKSTIFEYLKYGEYRTIEQHTIWKFWTTNGLFIRNYQGIIQVLINRR